MIPAIVTLIVGVAIVIISFFSQMERRKIQRAVFSQRVRRISRSSSISIATALWSRRRMNLRKRATKLSLI